MRTRAWWTAGVALVALAAPGAAQQEGAQPPPRPPGQAEEPELILEREVFEYPSFQRRNPFTRLVGNLAGPRFEEVELRGIIYDAEDPRNSVALISLRGRVRQQLQQRLQQQEQAQQQGTPMPQDTVTFTEPAMRLRAGDNWGNVRVLQIRRDHVVVEVTEFGLTDQHIMRMPVSPTRRQGGLS